MSGSAETANTESVLVMIPASEGFIPAEDLAEESLRFGSPAVVDAGNGSHSVYHRNMGNNLILGFPEEGAGLSSHDFAVKVAGEKKDGTKVFCYAKMIGYNGEDQIFATEDPYYISEDKASVKVTNFGVKTSHSAIVTAFHNKQSIATASLPLLKPGESKTLRSKSTHCCSHHQKIWLICTDL